MKPTTHVAYKNGTSRHHVRETRAPDPRATEDLIRLALAADEDEEWVYTWILQQRGTPEVLAAAQALCHSAVPEERALGADILGQLDLADPRLRDAAVTARLELPAREDDPDVLYSAAAALGQRHDPRAITALVRLRDQPDAKAREGVAHGLLRHEDVRAIAALIVLSDDAATDVRNWATFGLSLLVESNTRAIRAALYGRVDDWDEEIRGEALVGLARRGDPRLVEPLLRELGTDADEIGSLFIEAAIEAGQQLRDVRLYPALAQLEAFVDGYPADDLEEAMKLCWKQKP